MKTLLISLSLMTLLACFLPDGSSSLRANPTAEAAPRERLSLDAGWRFHAGDIPFPVINGHDATYTSTKAGRARGAAAPEFDDSMWRTVDVPHDWVVEGGFDPTANLSQGYRQRGFAWYRKHFRLDPSDRGRHLELQFDGIATHATVWVNGTLVHRNWCGYTSFYIDLTPFAHYGDELNTVVVRVDANAMEGWWYEGGGIYRHTWLVKRSPVHVITDGIHADPVRDAAGRWTIPLEAILENSGRDTADAEVAVGVFDPQGREVVRGSATARLAPLEQASARLTLNVAAPQLWSVDAPQLYEVRTTVRCGGVVADTVVTRCGFRTVRFDADRGFFLNDQPLKLKGVCNHQDHAGVGVAVPDSLWEFRLRRLKEMGANAIRVAHNPRSNEFMDACDRLGILVMDENRVFNCSPEYVRQLEWLVRRDRNHPCVILWSVFNEEPMQGTEMGYEMVRRMSTVVKRLDTTRPVTAAMNGGLFEPISVAQAVDVVGFNYQIGSYDRFHAANPHVPLTSSEDTSAFMTRGEYTTDAKRHVKDSYDTQAAPWGATHRAAWKAIAQRPWLAGGFVWTGFDYRGEPTPFQWPSAGSFFGIMDLCGFPKAAYYMHQAHWIENSPILRIEPHWNWAGREGQPIKVMVISNADAISLSLNGALIGEKANDKLDFVSWETPYAPGRLEAVAKDAAGREVARAFVETTGEPVALRLTPDRPALAADGWDATPITVEALDAQGRPVPTAGASVQFSLTGPGAIIGLGNGDPNCHEPEKGDRRSLFHGLAQVIVQSAPASSGELVLRATAAGLRPAELHLEVEPVVPRPAVPAVDPVLHLQAWRMSAIAHERPDPNVVVAGNDMNSWSSVRPGRLQTFTGGVFALYRTQFTPYAAQQRDGAQLVFQSLTGQAEVWLDGICLGRKSEPGAALFSVALPPGAGERQLTVLVEARPDSPAGLGGPATVLSQPARRSTP